MDGLTIIASRNARHQLAHQEAMASGLSRHGIKAVISHSANGIRTSHVACWGWRAGRPLRAMGKEVLVMERGYLGDRFAWTSLAWNGLNGRGTVYTPDDAGARFRKLYPPVHDWNPAGDYVLIAGQVPGDAALNGRCLRGWYAAQAAKDWGMPVMFRPHPLAARRGGPRAVPKAQTIEGELGIALARAAKVVTFNSNLGVDALVAGKPATADDEGSMIWSVTDRDQWAHRLAWRQWSLEEIADGSAWEVVSHGR